MSGRGAGGVGGEYRAGGAHVVRFDGAGGAGSDLEDAADIVGGAVRGMSHLEDAGDGDGELVSNAAVLAALGIGGHSDEDGAAGADDPGRARVRWHSAVDRAIQSGHERRPSVQLTFSGVVMDAIDRHRSEGTAAQYKARIRAVVESVNTEVAEALPDTRPREALRQTIRRRRRAAEAGGPVVRSSVAEQVRLRNDVDAMHQTIQNYLLNSSQPDDGGLVLLGEESGRYTGLDVTNYRRALQKMNELIDSINGGDEVDIEERFEEFEDSFKTVEMQFRKFSQDIEALSLRIDAYKFSGAGDADLRQDLAATFRGQLEGVHQINFGIGRVLDRLNPPNPPRVVPAHSVLSSSSSSSDTDSIDSRDTDISDISLDSVVPVPERPPVIPGSIPDSDPSDGSSSTASTDSSDSTNSTDSDPSINPGRVDPSVVDPTDDGYSEAPLITGKIVKILLAFLRLFTSMVSQANRRDVLSDLNSKVRHLNHINDGLSGHQSSVDATVLEQRHAEDAAFMRDLLVMVNTVITTLPPTYTPGELAQTLSQLSSSAGLVKAPTMSSALPKVAEDEADGPDDDGYSVADPDGDLVQVGPDAHELPFDMRSESDRGADPDFDDPDAYRNLQDQAPSDSGEGAANIGSPGNAAQISMPSAVRESERAPSVASSSSFDPSALQVEEFASRVDQWMADFSQQASVDSRPFQSRVDSRPSLVIDDENRSELGDPDRIDSSEDII